MRFTAIHPLRVAVALSLFLSHPPHARAQETPEPLPSHLRLESENGEPLTLEEVLTPGPTLIVFWRLDSRPSREALIHFHQNTTRITARGIRPVAVASGARASAADFVRQQGIRIESFYDPEGTVAAGYGLGYVYPSLLLLDENRRIAGKAEGGGASFDAHLARLLETGQEDTDGGRPWIAGAALLAVIALAAVLLGR